MDNDFDDLGIEFEQYHEGRRSLLDTIYDEGKKSGKPMLFGAPWNRFTEYSYRAFVISACALVLLMTVLACC